jgi:hypothetical protein
MSWTVDVVEREFNFFRIKIPSSRGNINLAYHQLQAFVEAPKSALEQGYQAL